jgi:tetratricopeptide (TPR) repeat protein
VLFGDDGFKPTRRASDPDQNIVTTALVDRRGSCAVLIAVALALTEDLDEPFQAVVLREHVLLGLEDSPDTLYEVLEKGKELSESKLARYEPFPPGGPIRVSGADYIPYYLDNLAARFAEAGDAEKAAQTFQKALELGPRAARIYYNYGTFLLQNRPQEALEHLTRAIRLGWKDADAFVNRGVALWKLGRTKAAERDYRKALTLDPENRRAKANLRQLREIREERGSR